MPSADISQPRQRSPLQQRPCVIPLTKAKSHGDITHPLKALNGGRSLSSTLCGYSSKHTGCGDSEIGGPPRVGWSGQQTTKRTPPLSRGRSLDSQDEAIIACEGESVLCHRACSLDKGLTLQRRRSALVTTRPLNLEVLHEIYCSEMRLSQVRMPAGYLCVCLSVCVHAMPPI